MAGFVKLDSAILNSSLWLDRDQRSIFVTAMLMAYPRELKDPTPQIEVQSLEHTGWMVPPGWYGFVEAAGVGILRRDGIGQAAGYRALESLCSPDPDSRSQDFEGRRMARVNGGYVVLNYMRYRERDYSQTGPDAIGYVYYAGEPGGDRVKIGFSRNPWARISALRTSNPRLMLLGIERSVAASVEYERHRQFKEAAIEREWFNLTPALVAHIALHPAIGSTTGSSPGSGTDSATPAQKQSTEVRSKNLKTTASVSGDPARNGASPEKPSVPWVTEGVAWWKGNVGMVKHGHFGAALSEPVREYTWPQVFDALKCYVQENKARGKTVKINWFADEIIQWIEWSRMPATDTNGNLTPRAKAINRELGL